MLIPATYKYISERLKEVSSYNELMMVLDKTVIDDMMNHASFDVLECIHRLPVNSGIEDAIMYFGWLFTAKNDNDSILEILYELSRSYVEKYIPTVTDVSNINRTALAIAFILSPTNDRSWANEYMTDELALLADAQVHDGISPKDQLKDFLLSYHMNQMSIELSRDLSMHSMQLGSIDSSIIYSVAMQIYDSYRTFAKVNESCSDIATVHMGALIAELMTSWEILNELSKNTGIRPSIDNYKSLLEIVYNVFEKYFAASKESKALLRELIRNFNGYDKGWFDDKYLVAQKILQDSNPVFQAFLESIDTPKYQAISTPTGKENYTYLLNRFYSGAVDESVTEATGDKAATSYKTEHDGETNEAPEFADSSSSSDDYDSDSEEDNDEEPSDSNIQASQSTKGQHKSSRFVGDGTRKIYKAYKNFKNNEERVTSQMDKMLKAAKRAFGIDRTEAVIQGKTWTPMDIVKKILATGAIFNFSKIGGFLYLITSIYLDKRRTDAQRREILGDLETEIRLLEEKIQDASADGNRKAKYALMRTKGELEKARDKIRFGMKASAEDMQTARDIITGRRSREKRNYDRDQMGAY